MPLFTYPPQPWSIYLDDIQAGAVTTLTAGRIYLNAVVISAPVTIVAMQCTFSAVPTGNCDMGIYDTGFNLLGHTGAIAAATGIFRQNLIANLTLGPNRYWLAWLDTVADSIVRQFGSASANQSLTQRSNATTFTQLVSFAVVQIAGDRVGVQALVQGGYPV